MPVTAAILVHKNNFTTPVSGVDKNNKKNNISITNTQNIHRFLLENIKMSAKKQTTKLNFIDFEDLLICRKWKKKHIKCVSVLQSPKSHK